MIILAVGRSLLSLACKLNLSNPIFETVCPGFSRR